MSLSKAQMSVIWPGLEFIILAFLTRVKTETCQFAYPFRVYWKRWGELKRGDYLRDLPSRGCSIRGLASDLGVPSTTLRRYATLSSLPDADREALEGGGVGKNGVGKKCRQGVCKSRAEEAR